jgi:hypothetical protein
MTIREEMICNAIGHNKYLTREYLRKKRTRTLLAFCHPLEREQYVKRLNQKKDIS